MRKVGFSIRTKDATMQYMKKSMESLRVPPHSLEAEQALLGSLMMRPQSLHEVVDFVSADFFYADKHRVLFKTIVELHSKGEPIDLVSVTTKLKERKETDRAGGMPYITEIVRTVPSTTNVEYYAEIVAEKATLRGLIEAGDSIAEMGYRESSEIEEVLDEAEKTVHAITSSQKSQKFVGIKEILPDVWNTIENLHESSDELRGIPTGFTSLDNKLAGFQKSDLIILAARPSMGKTSLALDIARQTAIKHNIPVGIFSLEMSSQQLVDRMVASESRVDAWKLRTGKKLTEDEFVKIRDAMDRLSKAPIYIDDQPGQTILKMRSTARRLKSEYGLGLLIVDYLQLITTTKNYDSMVNQVTEISRSLKSIARELKVPVLALSQLSRAVEARGGKPRLSDLRDSGSIEQDADVVMFIHREDKYKENSDRPNIAEILIEKHRNGPTGVAELYFDGDKITFMNIENNDFAEIENASRPNPDPFF